jgi:hypothetical protein
MKLGIFVAELPPRRTTTQVTGPPRPHFVLTGPATSGMAAQPRENFARRSKNVPGVFAVGDVRSGSVKRVGGAIGEGAATVARIHWYLAAARSSSQSHDAPRG